MARLPVSVVQERLPERLVSRFSPVESSQLSVLSVPVLEMMSDSLSGFVPKREANREYSSGFFSLFSKENQA